MRIGTRLLWVDEEAGGEGLWGGVVAEEGLGGFDELLEMEESGGLALEVDAESLIVAGEEGTAVGRCRYREPDEFAIVVCQETAYTPAH